MCEFILIPQDNVTCLSPGKCLFKPPHWGKDSGLQVGKRICRLEASFPPAGFSLLLNMGMHGFHTKENANTIHYITFLGKGHAVQGVAAQESSRALEACRRQQAQP